jgi:uncharacterized protein (TIGR02001 family)
MKKTLLLVALAALAPGVATLSAQTPSPAAAAPAAAPAAPAAPSGPSWVVTGAVNSQYMFRGVRLGGPSFNPAVEYDNGDLAVGVWSNIPIKDKVKGQSDPEFDFYGSYKLELVKDTLNWQPGFTAYTYPNAKRADGFYRATFEPNVALNYTVSGITLTPKVYYDFVLKGPTLELGAAYTVPLKDMGTELDFVATAGTYKWTNAAPGQGADVKNYGNYVLGGVTLPFQVTKDSKITLGWAYTKGSDNFIKVGRTAKFENSAAVGRGVATISYIVTF